MDALPFSPRYRHIGGSIVSASGASISLAAARAWAEVWGRAAIEAAAAGCRDLAGVCARDALALSTAAEACARWRKAAGWRNPAAADASAAQPPAAAPSGPSA